MSVLEMHPCLSKPYINSPIKLIYFSSDTCSSAGCLLSSELLLTLAVILYKTASAISLSVKLIVTGAFTSTSPGIALLL